jgi:precorrin-2 dehydrogenase/sirohydrochlorin ferrochelatase
MKPNDPDHSSAIDRRTPVLFPLFLKLQGRSCLVVGAGQVGEEKIKGLLAAGASVRVVAPQATQAVQEWSREGRLIWQARTFDVSDLEGVFLLIVATPDRQLNEAIFRRAQQRGILTNVVDDPPLCDFYYPAVVRRGPLQIAISTGGNSPALARRLRQDLERQFGPEYAEWVEELGAQRQRLLAEPIGAEARREQLRALASSEGFEAFRRTRRAGRVKHGG